MKFLRIPEPQTKPQRYMLVKDDNVIAKGMTKQNCLVIMAALIRADEYPQLQQTTIQQLKNQGL